MAVTPRAAKYSCTLEQAFAFRLVRQHLAARSPGSDLLTVLSEICGVQAQMLTAAKAALSTRLESITLDDIDGRIESNRSIVRAACMRRTLHLVSAADVELFVTGTAKRARKDIRWILNKGVNAKLLERGLAAAAEALSVPLTRSELIAETASRSRLPITHAEDGWWGNTRKLPAIQMGPIACPANYLLALLGSRAIICYADNRGSEPTFVRADAWVPASVATDNALNEERAEEALLRRYLRVFGPADPADFAAWTGLRRSDAAAVWKRIDSELDAVDLEGRRTFILASDLPMLRRADVPRPSVRLLPYFDSYLLGHSVRSHIASEYHARVYRKQGWISAVLLIDGFVAGTWTHEIRNANLEVLIEPFRKLTRNLTRLAREEAERLAAFLGCDGATVTVE